MVGGSADFSPRCIRHTSKTATPYRLPFFIAARQRILSLDMITVPEERRKLDTGEPSAAAAESRRPGLAQGLVVGRDDQPFERVPHGVRRDQLRCAERTTQEAVDTLGAAMIPAAPVLSPQQALDHPHIRAAGFLKSVDYPGLPNAAPVARAAVRLSQTPGEIVTRPPKLGEHTDVVLADLGYDAAAIAALRDKGVV